MMEIGQWVFSDNYSGRIVKISNAFVFKGPVYNYSKNFPFVWDEITLPIRYDSDMELAKSIIIAVAQEQLCDYVDESMLKQINRVLLSLDRPNDYGATITRNSLVHPA